MAPVVDGAVLAAVAEIVGRRLEIDPETIDPAASIVDDFGAESIDIIAIVAHLENHFDIEIPSEAIMRARTVAQIAMLLPGGLAGAPPAGEPQ
jgi:acyl carrier protein